MTLETGKLYQVYFNKKWVIAEYVRTIEPHTERYSNLNMYTMKLSPEHTRQVPRTHVWKRLATGDGCGFHAPAKDSDLRPVTDETLAEIARLKGELKKNDEERIAIRRELRDLTN